MAKCILHIARPLAMNQCSNFNLCAGMRAKIKGASHAIREVGLCAPTWLSPHQCQTNAQTDRPRQNSDSTATQTEFPRLDHHPLDPKDPEGTLLVNAQNGSNEIS